MNFKRSKSEKSDKSSAFLEGKDRLLYYSKYSQVNSTRTSMRGSFSSATTDDFNIDINFKDINKDPIENLTNFKSKIGYVKLGFSKISNINPIARYNFYLERYNEEINLYNNINLQLIPCHIFVLKVFDFYFLYLRILLGMFLIIFAGITDNYNHKTFKTYFQHYHIKAPINSTEWNSEINNNWIFLIFSIISLILNSILLVYCWWVIFIPIFLATILLYYSFYLVSQNNKKIKNNFYRNMIFDEEIDNSNKLNDYITVIPGGIEEYLGCTYYTILVFLYRKRDITVPQQFMLYGNNYKNEKDVIKNILIGHLISTGLILIYGMINLLV